MSVVPAAIAATWPKPNYVDPETRGPLLLRVELSLLALSLLVVSLRTYIRFWLIRSPGWDDWLILAALVPAIGVVVSVCLASQVYSWNVHIWDMIPADVVPARKISWACQMIFCFASVLTKLSLLSMLLRIAHTKIFRNIIFTVMAFTVLYIPIFVPMLMWQCRPVSDYWNVFNRKGKCIHALAPLMASCAYNLLLDGVIYVLPLPALWRVNLPLRQRLSLIAIFAMGSLVVIGGAFRTYWVWYVIEKTYDTTWYGFKLWMWTAVEINLGIICASLPTLKPLVSKFLDKKSSTARYGYGPGRAASKQAGVLKVQTYSTTEEVALRSMDIASHQWEIKAAPTNLEQRESRRSISTRKGSPV